MAGKGPEVLAGEESDGSKILMLLEYLTVIFRDKNKLLEIERPNREIYRLGEKLVSYAIFWGAKQRQIRFEITEGKAPAPQVTIKNEEGNTFVQVSFDQALFKSMWNDMERIMPITLLAFMPGWETIINEKINQLKNSKAKLPTDPEKLKTTATLRQMMVEIYQLWQSF